MRVKANPNHGRDGKPPVVLDPRTGKPFPAGEFELSVDDLKDPRVLRLLPHPNQGGVAGGAFGDLIIVNPEPAKKGK